MRTTAPAAARAGRGQPLAWNGPVCVIPNCANDSERRGQTSLDAFAEHPRPAGGPAPTQAHIAEHDSYIDRALPVSCVTGMRAARPR